MAGWLVPWIVLGCTHHPVDELESCAAPAPLPERLFSDATGEVGLQGARANTLIAHDIDGDGWIDLLSNGGMGIGPHLWRNVGGKFEDATTASALQDRTKKQVVVPSPMVAGDVDNDGDLDLFVGDFRHVGHEGSHQILLNDGHGTFRPAPPSGVGFRSPVTGVSFVDFDRDGWLDLWIVNWYDDPEVLTSAAQDRLLRGHGDGTFEDVTGPAGLLMPANTDLADALSGRARRPGMGATACDIDGDGDDDLLRSTYGRNWNQQWRNEDGHFVDVARTTGFADDPIRDYHDDQSYVCWCEFHPGCDPAPGPLWLSQRCDELATWWTPGYDDQAANLAGNTFTTVCGDVDADGDLDVLDTEIVHSRVGDASDPTELLLNDGSGRFTRPGREATGLARPRTGMWNEGDLMGAFLDVDNDGALDLYIGDSDYDDTRARLYRQVRPLWFEDLFPAAGVDHPRAKGIAIADFDNDGDLDLVMGSSMMRGGPWKTEEVRYFRSELGPSHWIDLELEGTKANRSGIGAWVEVVQGGRTQVFEVSGGYGHGGIQNTTALHIGLGSTCSVDEVHVRWPTLEGNTDVWRDLDGDGRWHLTEGGGIRRVP
jgi:enediyne biosynthesis protein E4